MKGTNSAYRGLGTIDFRASARSVLLVGRHRKTPNARVIVHDKSSLAPEGKSMAFNLGNEEGFKWLDGYDKITADELLGGGEAETKTDQAEDLILDMLSSGDFVPAEKIFAKARKAERAIIFFDEFEAIGAKRTDNADNGNNDLVPQILAEMQGVGNSNSKAVIMVIAATNKPWAIDSAFLRPGRFDEKIYIPLPDFEARRKMFELKLKGTPVDQLDFDELARVSDGFNGADITEFCEKLKMEAIKETLSSGTEHKITKEDVTITKGKIKSSVSDEDIAELLEFEKNI
jgi:transitional endoplasmic reticulum ATPase